MKILKLLLILLAVIILGLGIVAGANLKDIRAFLPMASAAYAKFMCSSIFVEGKNEEQARNWSRTVIPVKGYKVDYATKSVTATALGKTSTARYMGERFGCTLD